MRWIGFMAVAILGISTQSTADHLDLKWYTWEPRAIDVDRTEPVTLTAKVVDAPAAVQVNLAGGAGTVNLTPIGGDLYEATFDPSQVLAGHDSTDLHNFVGFFTWTGGPNINLFVNVITNDVPDVSITAMAPDVQASPHLVNIRWDPLFTGSHVGPDVTRRFYDLFPDDFDFIATIAQVESNHNRSYRGLRNDVTGLGINIFDNAVPYGSPARLQGTMNYPLSTYFDAAERATLHEIGHRWINFLDGPGVDLAVPHWPISSFADSIMGWGQCVGCQGLNFAFDIIELPDGTYQLTSDPQPQVYNDAERYLMGLIGPKQVSEHFVFENQSQSVFNGAILQGPVIPVTIEDIIAVNGPRVPAAGAAPTKFNLATIVLSAGGLLSAEEMAFFDHMAARGESTVPLPYSSGFVSGTTNPFFVATDGLGTLCTTVIPDCPADFNGSGSVDFNDLLELLAAWGPCAGCPEDFDQNGLVDFNDLLVVLAEWGPC